MTEPATLSVRILSGLHAGARMTLADGDWIAGRDDSCDIILADGGIAPRHACLTVKGGVLKAAALDGEVTDDQGNALPEGALLLPGTAYRLGGVRFACGPEDADDAFWEAAAAVSAPAAETPGPEEAKEEESSEPAAPGAQPEASREEKGAAAAVPETEAAEAAEPAEESRASEEKPEPEKKGGCGKGLLAALIGLLILFALILLALARLDAQGPAAQRLTQFCTEKGIPFNLPRIQSALSFARPAASDAGVLASAREALSQAGLAGVNASVQPDGYVRFSGVVADDAERGALVRIARGLSRPASLAVTVETDLTEPLKSAFNARDFWPSVALRSRGGDGLDLVVSGYMLNNEVEESAFADAVRTSNVAEAQKAPAKVRIGHRIVYRSDLAPIIESALAGAGAEGVTAEYLPGRIRLLATLTPERRAQIESAVKRIREHAGVPLQIEILNKFVTNMPSNPEKPVVINKARKPAAAAPNRPVFKVIGVSGGAMKHVTLSDGGKYFAGARLPGGYILRSVGEDHLVLERGGRQIIYPLKVSE